MPPRECQCKGELDERMFAESLTGFGRAIAGSVFGRDEKAMGVTDATITYGLLDSEMFIVGLVCECGSPASITGLAGRAEWATCRFEIFSQQHCVKVFGDIATTGIGFCAARKQLA